MVELDLDDVLAGVLERHCEMAKVLDQLAAWALDGDGTGLNADLDTLWDGQGLLGVNVPFPDCQFMLVVICAVAQLPLLSHAFCAIPPTSVLKPCRIFARVREAAGRRQFR